MQKSGVHVADVTKGTVGENAPNYAGQMFVAYKAKGRRDFWFYGSCFFFLSLWDVPGCLSNMHHLSDSKTLSETWFPRCVTHNISCSNSFIRLHSSFQTERNSLWLLLNASRPDHCCTCLTHSFTSFIIFILKPYVTILPWNENFSITFNSTVTFRGRSYWLEKKE